MREHVKRLPVVGPLLYSLYLKIRYKEGEVLTIRSGLLKGNKLHRFMRTVMAAYVEGDYEEPLQNAFKRELSPGQTVFDVGANGGFMTMLTGNLVGSTGKVVAFEAHPESASQIRKQLSLNNLEHCHVVAAAASDQVGSTDFADDISADMLSIATLRKDSPGFTIRVDTTTLDEQAKEHGIPDLIKIDVEGAELMVLHGAAGLLRDHHPVLFIELHSDDLCKSCFAYLGEHGYKLFDLSGEPTSGNDFQRFVIARHTHP